MTGWFKCPNEILDCDALTGAEKLVLLSLLRHRNEETGTCFPSVPLIAKEAGIVTKSWALKIISRLEEKELIYVERKIGRPNIYHIPNVEVLQRKLTSIPKIPVSSEYQSGIPTTPVPVSSEYPNKTNVTRLNNKSVAQTDSEDELTRDLKKCGFYFEGGFENPY